MNVDENVIKKVESWLNGPYDDETKAGVRKLMEADDKTELVESFYKDLEFGTGGLRGIMGVGSNRMNVYTVGAATQGLCNYLNREFKQREQVSVVVGHDCRNNSRLFAETVANIFSANGIKVYLFEALRPTPEISFAIRRLGCQSGVIITASHNPKEYNGYKAYWEDGAQIVAPHDVNIIKEVAKIQPADVKFKPRKELIQIIGEGVDAMYIEQVKTVSLSPEAIEQNSDIKIVYTPIHGTGITLIPRCLCEMGFKNVSIVEEQAVVSGDFPTVASPNPEEPAALDMAIQKAREIDADIVMASDPDADRMGIAVKNNRGEWTLVTGNQTAMIFTHYILSRRKEKGLLTKKDFMVKTIVTTEMIRKICKSFNTELVDCYTGFKWIASEIRLREGKRNYIGGGEESYGYMPLDFVRDKDSVICCALMAEIVAWARMNGMSLYDYLMSIYIEYGFSKEKGISVVKKGKSGAEEIQMMMKNYRSCPPQTLADSKVVKVKDYQLLMELNLLTGARAPIDFNTTSNVLQYFTEDGTKVSVRPSGTEPKIKYYIEVQMKMKNEGDYEKCDRLAETKMAAIMNSF